MLMTRMEVDPEGKFSLNRIPAGKYDVSVAFPNYVAAYLNDPAGKHLPLTVEINSSEPVHRDLILARAASTIDGTVVKDGEPQAGCFVLLMPKDRSRRLAYRFDQTDSDGSFAGDDPGRRVCPDRVNPR